MENRLISMVGTQRNMREGSAPAAAGEGDADAFSQALDQAQGSRAMDAEDGGAMIAEERQQGEKKTDQGARSQDTSQARELDQRLQQRLNQRQRLVGLKAYLYHLAYKDPDTLSLAEKQALRLDEYSPEQVGLKELRQMLGQRGLTWRDLTFSQMAQLTRSNSRSQMRGLLDRMVREGLREISRTASSKEKELAAPSPSQMQPLEPLAGAADLQATARASEAREQEQRRQVIEQILQHIEVRNLADRDELHLKLNPEYLGELRVKLVRDRSGQVSAGFETTSQVTRALLEENRQELQAAARSRGVPLGEVEVALVQEIE